MPARLPFDPAERSLYGEGLKPPAGYRLDAAVATTYSLDFASALTAPVNLAMFAAENQEELLRHPLELLNAIQSVADRIVVYCQVGAIHADVQRQSLLCGLLEDLIVQVKAPGGGVFHPKIWVLRFRPTDGRGAARFRLLILSRNLTRDQSWDLCLRLEGELQRGTSAINAPLVRLLRALPRMAIHSIGEQEREVTREIAADLKRVRWELPPGFDSIGFAVNGVGMPSWGPPSCTTMGVISPFCDAQAFRFLRSRTRNPLVFVGRDDQLNALDRDALAQFESLRILNDSYAAENGEEETGERLHGLHAKAFVTQYSYDTSITVGSGNATTPALVSGRNVEVFATLTGKSSRVGSVKKIFGEGDFASLLQDFQPHDVDPELAEQTAAEDRLERATRSICAAGLMLRCDRSALGGDDQNSWRLRLVASRKIDVGCLSDATVWPIMRGELFSADALPILRNGGELDLGVMSLADVTCFLAFRLTDSGSNSLFSLGLPLEGSPAGRRGAIFRALIGDRDKFFRYLRLLLADAGAATWAFLDGKGGGGTIDCKWAGQGEPPILEAMVRALCADEDQLRSIGRLLESLSCAEGGEDPAPEEFRRLWSQFQAVLSSEARP